MLLYSVYKGVMGQECFIFALDLYYECLSVQSNLLWRNKSCKFLLIFSWFLRSCKDRSDRQQ